MQILPILLLTFALPVLLPAQPAGEGAGRGAAAVVPEDSSAIEAAGSAARSEGAARSENAARSERVGTSETPPRSKTVRITGGEYVPHYTLTSDPEPRVDIETFELAVHPVTVGEYLDFVRARPEWRRSRAPAALAGDAYLAGWAGDLEPGGGAASASRRPVTEITWFAARAYCSWRGMRLPTTDEWEYVARAGEEEVDGFRDPALNRRLLDLHYARPGPDELPPVGRTFRNAHGVWDMHGLVWEWTSDFNNQMLTGAGRDDQSLDRGLFCAAGSVGATDIENYAAFLRYAYRSSLTGDYSGRLLGFRCAASR